mgnify:CR=1 FL=1
MKTNLTLKTGAFYFLSTANLTRNIPVSVDLETLSQAELDSIKAYIAVGHIESSEEISEYNVEEQSEAPVVKEEKTETAPEEAKEVETKVKEDYTEMTVKELKAEVAKRNIDTEATRKDDLIQVLEENDTSKE